MSEENETITSAPVFEKRADAIRGWFSERSSSEHCAGCPSETGAADGRGVGKGLNDVGRELDGIDEGGGDAVDGEFEGDGAPDGRKLGVPARD